MLTKSSILCILLSCFCLSYAENPESTITLSQQASIAEPTLIPAAPDVNAAGFVLMDPKSHKIIAEKNMQKKMDPASLTKLMVLYIAEDALKAGQIHLDDQVKVSRKAWAMQGSKAFLRESTWISVKELIDAIIIVSANDATIALTEHIAGNEQTFVTLMNQTAKTLQMQHSHFNNTTGLPDLHHYSSPEDIAILASHLINDFPEYYKLYSKKWFSYNKIKQVNRNRLLWRDPSVDGMKTGHTHDAGFCLVASALRHNTRLLTVIFAAPSDTMRFAATDTLLAYGFRYFQSRLIFTKNKPLYNAELWGGKTSKLSSGLAKDFFITLTTRQNNNLKLNIHTKPRLSPPIHAGEVIGHVDLNSGATVIATQPLIALTDAEPGSLGKRFTANLRWKIHQWWQSLHFIN
jgi:serine-type D-Ala-D-Ala carboxypeptidase (penicillin-binding protein 5/6)